MILFFIFDISVLFAIPLIILGLGGFMNGAQWILNHIVFIMSCLFLKSIVCFFPLVVTNLRRPVFSLASLFTFVMDLSREVVLFSMIVNELQALFSGEGDLFTRIFTLAGAIVGIPLLLLIGIAPMYFGYVSVACGWDYLIHGDLKTYNDGDPSSFAVSALLWEGLSVALVFLAYRFFEFDCLTLFIRQLESMY